MSQFFSKTSTVVWMLIIVGGLVVYFGMNKTKKAEAPKATTPPETTEGV